MHKKYLLFGISLLSVLALLGCNSNNDNTSKTGGTKTETTTFYTIPDKEEENLDIYYHGLVDLKRYSNKDDLISYYNDLEHACENFDHLKEDASKEELTINGKKDDYYVVSRVNYGKYNLSTNQAIAIWKLIGLDHPEYYWISTTVVKSNIDGNDSLVLLTEEDYALYEKRKEIQETIDEFARNLKILLDKTDEYIKKIELIHDYICEYATYAYNDEGLADSALWAHNIVGIPMYNKGVCEAYAKLFTYLCQLNEIDALTVTGSRKNKDKLESHAWNLVKIEDSWYAVDVTWDDSLRTTKYFCCGYKDISVSHVPDESTSLADGIDYVYNLPSISIKNYFE